VVGDSMVPLVSGLSARQDHMAQEISAAMALVTTPMTRTLPIVLRNPVIPTMIPRIPTIPTPQVQLPRSPQAPQHPRHPRHRALQALSLQIAPSSVQRQLAPHLNLALPHATLLSPGVVLQAQPKPQQVVELFAQNRLGGATWLMERTLRISSPLVPRV
jgi:hypothetical protein